jgi:hypothetical protein
MLREAREQLARKEYTNKFLLTLSFFDAEQAYRKILGVLDAEIPEDLEAEVIKLRSKMLDILQPEILQTRRREFQELQLLHAHLRRLTLVDEVAETGIPDEVLLENLRHVEGDELTSIINGFAKLQEMRREITSS